MLGTGGGFPPVGARAAFFDVVGDPDERHNVATANPAIVARLLARLAVLAKSFAPDPVVPDNGRFCEAAARRGGFLGPWLDSAFDSF